MKKVSILILAILLSAITLSGFAAAQSSGYTYTINIQGILSQFGLGGSDTIVNVGGVSQVVLTDPVIVMGSGLDIEEKQILRSVQTGDLDESRVVPDTARQFNGQDLSRYDLIVLGGPEHNAYAKKLLDEGYLKYKITDKKFPTIIFEAVTVPGGKTVAVIGDASGYAYHKKDLPLNSVIPEEMAPAAAVGTGLGIGLLGLLFAKLTGMSGSIFEWVRNFMGGYLMTHVQEKASDIEANATKVAVKKRKTLILFYLVMLVFIL